MGADTATNPRPLRPPLSLVAPLLAAAASLLIAFQLFHGSLLASDENGYVFQAYAYLDGRLAREPIALPSAHQGEMQIIDERVGWTSRYPPAHGVWLMPGAAVGEPRLMSAVAAALGVLLLGHLARRLGGSERAIHVLLVISPFYLFMYATLLSHTSGLLFATLLVLGYLRWQETGATRFAAGAGLAWAFLFLGRPFTASLVALPFAVDAVAQRLRGRSSWAGLAAFAGCSAIGFAGWLLHNYLVTGDALLPPFLYYDPGARLGFGVETLGNTVYEHTPAQGIENVWDNLRLLDRWLLGVPGGLVLVAAMAVLGWSRRWSPLLVGAAGCLLLGQMLYYFPGVRDFGPVYSFEALAFLLPLLALGLERALPALRRRHALLVPGLVALLAVVSLDFMRREVSEVRPRKRYEATIRETIGRAPANSLILLTGIPEEPFLEHLVFNPRGLESERLVVWSTPEREEALLRLHAERKPFRISRGAEETLQEP